MSRAQKGIQNLKFIKDISEKGRRGESKGLYICACGEHKRAIKARVKCNHIKSCGCITKLPPKNKTHGESESSEFRIWGLMKDRCYNLKSPAYVHYGGRGIAVCSQWLSFENFLNDMGHKPKGKTLDRIDNDKGYSVENCKWATRKEQANNRRSSRNLTFGDITLTLSGWGDTLEVKSSSISNRIDILKWSVEKALTTVNRFVKYKDIEDLKKEGML